MPVSPGKSKSVDPKHRPGAGKVRAVRGSSTRTNRPGRKVAPAKPGPERSSPLGSRIIAGMENLLTTMKSGGLKAVEKKFTVRRVKKTVFEKPALGKADVVAIRTSLGTSQMVFANLLGVSVATVRAWEQGVNEPSGIALRFLAEVRANPDYWKARLKEAATT